MLKQIGITGMINRPHTGINSTFPVILIKWLQQTCVLDMEIYTLQFISVQRCTKPSIPLGRYYVSLYIVGDSQSEIRIAVQPFSPFLFLCSTEPPHECSMRADRAQDCAQCISNSGTFIRHKSLTSDFSINWLQACMYIWDVWHMQQNFINKSDKSAGPPIHSSALLAAILSWLAALYGSRLAALFWRSPSLAL